MATETDSMQSISTAKKKAWVGTITRVAKYTLMRVGTMAVTVVVGVYLTILIANMGGYVDEIMRGNIRENIAMTLRNQPSYQELSPEAQELFIPV